MLTKIWLITSGGVMIAERVTKRIAAIFLFFLSAFGVSMPALLRKYTKTGSSNTSPVANDSVVTKEM